MDKIDIAELREFLELKDLNQISIRVYYLYYRTLEGLREQRNSLFRYSFDTIMAVIDLFLAFVAFQTFLQGVADLYKTAAVLLAIVVAVLLLFARERLAPRGELATLTETLRLAVHLDQILKQAVEIMLLGRLLKRSPKDQLVRDMASDNCCILNDSIGSVEDLVGKLTKDQKLEKAVEEIHIDRTVLQRRIALGKSVLEKYRSLLR